MSTSLVPQIELLGNYCLNEQFGYIEDGQRSGLRVLKKLQPNFDFDLLDGYTGNNSCLHESYQIRNKIDNVIMWIVNHHELISTESGDKPFDVDFVCSNGMFKKILNFSFEQKPVKHEFAVSKYKGIIFMKRIEKEEDEFVLNYESSYAGCRFEDYMSKKLNPEDESQKYYNILKTKFGNHVLLYSCEVDCIKEREHALVESQLEIDDFVEIKTATPIKDKYTGSFTDWFRRTVSRRWWAQCVMAGITQIIVGIKDQSRDGSYIHCMEIEKIAVGDLDRNAINWSSKQAFQMLNTFLNKIKEKVTENNPDIIHLFIIETEKEIVHEKFTSHGHKKFTVLTESMIEKFNDIN